jgi:glycosyltransferase involved in cell wall biosynthesis
MKVAAFASGQGPETGGGFTFQEELLDAIQRVPTNHEVSVVQFAGGRPFRTSLPRVEIPAPSLIDRAAKAIERTGAFAGQRAGSAAERALREHGFDIVWFLSAGLHMQLDMPYVTVVWDVEHRNHPYFPELTARGQWAIREAMYRELLPRATYVIVGTQVGRNEIERYYGVARERIRVLPHPTPRFALEAAPRTGAGAAQRHGLAREYLIYPAQFWAHKNHANLVLALKVLKERGVVIDLALVGSDKGNRAHIEQLARDAGVAAQVKFLGFVEQDDLVGLYRDALGLAYLSFCGPENLPPLEAFALGCPVVASRIPGHVEQLGDAAELVVPHDPADIARGIEAMRARRDELRAKGLARAKSWTGRELVQGVFTALDEFEPVRRAWM